MAIALHDPEVGYYTRPATPLGAHGDYFTSPELHPAFAVLLGRQILQLWEALGKPNPFVIHEAGPGSGHFARDLLDWARHVGNPSFPPSPRLERGGWGVRATEPDFAAIEYRLDESSPTLRARQRELLDVEPYRQTVRWVEGFQPDSPAHLVFANELLDSFPVHLIQMRDGRLEELYVADPHPPAPSPKRGRGREGGKGLELEPGPPSTPEIPTYFERLAVWPGEGCRAEVNLAALDWLRRAEAAIDRGLLVVLDYGYPAEQLYAPTRRAGSLLCYYRHTLSSDPLERIGEQDITTHVDFTSLRQAGEAAGLATLGLVSQATLLENLGLDAFRQRTASAPIGQARRDANLRALDALLDPAGLGRIQALFQQHGLPGFEPIGLIGAPPPPEHSLPLATARHVRLPDPAEAEGLPEFESQWSEFWKS
jgi:SAM-dependent MidA family methyltransferase